MSSSVGSIRKLFCLLKEKHLPLIKNRKRKCTSWLLGERLVSVSQCLSISFSIQMNTQCCGYNCTLSISVCYSLWDMLLPTRRKKFVWIFYLHVKTTWLRNLPWKFQNLNLTHKKTKKQKIFFKNMAETATSYQNASIILVISYTEKYTYVLIVKLYKNCKEKNKLKK